MALAALKIERHAYACQKSGGDFDLPWRGRGEADLAGLELALRHADEAHPRGRGALWTAIPSEPEARQKASELQNRRLEVNLDFREMGVGARFEVSNLSLPCKAMCLLTMVDAKGMIASPEDALEVGDELLDMALELQDRSSRAALDEFRVLTAGAGQAPGSLRVEQACGDLGRIECQTEARPAV